MKTLALFILLLVCGTLEAQTPILHNRFTTNQDTPANPVVAGPAVATNANGTLYISTSGAGGFTNYPGTNLTSVSNNGVVTFSAGPNLLSNNQAAATTIIGTITDTNVVSISNGNNSIGGTFTGNGAAITSLNGSSISSGTVSTSHLPVATSSALGVVEPDGTTLFVNGSGVVNAVTATSSEPGIVKPDGSTITISGGVISATGSSQSFNANQFSTAGGDVSVISGAFLTNPIITKGVWDGFTQGNTLLGTNMASVSSQQQETAVGAGALGNDSSGQGNIAIGYGALGGLLTSGTANIAIGYQSLLDNNGTLNTAIGNTAMSAGRGTNNIVLGQDAGSSYSGGESSNIDIGNSGTGGESFQIHIGTTGVQTNCTIAGVINGNGGGLTNISGGSVVSPVTAATNAGVATNVVANFVSTNLYPYKMVNGNYTFNGTNDRIVFQEASTNTTNILPSMVTAMTGAIYTLVNKGAGLALITNGGSSGAYITWEGVTNANGVDTNVSWIVGTNGSPTNSITTQPYDGTNY